MNLCASCYDTNKGKVKAMNETPKNSILVIDDSKFNITILNRILVPDYTVYTETDGRHAVAVAEKYLPDLILLDIVMPDMDGYAVIAALKQSEKTMDIPIIFITGLNTSGAEEKGLAAGASDYIIKPFTPMIVKLRVQNQMKILEQLRTIRRLSMTDQLTDLPNRRSFELRLNSEWSRARREQTPIGILVVDVDNFKQYNDTHGHQQGDAALQAVANVFMQELHRPGDFGARWGGEEFIALLSNTDASGTLHVAEKIRKRIAMTAIPHADNVEANITVSIGINTEIPDQTSSRDSFISKADKALYKAKANGRNRVRAADP